MTTPKEPILKEDERSRQSARYTRDRQWQVLEKMAEHGTIHICWWDKKGVHKSKEKPDDLLVFGLLNGMDLAAWLRSHPDWVEMGEWDDERYAMPATITEAGRTALREKDKYDLEPVVSGLVEPGWQAVPAERKDPKQSPADQPT